jgi:uncharacterized membrane-anchored protein
MAPSEHLRPGAPEGITMSETTATRKLPQVTFVFWIMKIAATTLGETGGDLLAQTLRIGYLASSLLFLAIFAVSLIFQLKAKSFHSALYWMVITPTSTAGTTISDYINRSAGLGYAKGALVLITCLAVVIRHLANQRPDPRRGEHRHLQG